MTPEFNPAPPEPLKPETSAPQEPKAGFFRGLAITLTPGAAIVAGLSYGVPAIALLGITAATGFIGTAIAIKKKASLTAFGGLSAAITGFGISLSGASVPLVAFIACCLGVSVADKYAAKNQNISMPKVLAGAFIGASLSVVMAAAAINAAPAEQKRHIDEVPKKTALAPAFNAAQNVLSAGMPHTKPMEKSPSLTL